MNCPSCQSTISVDQTHCEVCGSDVLIFSRLYKLSNSYYNKALEKAKVRDLSGAVFLLRRSLKINKSNSNARNLLGLILFEMGETVDAISEWVVSKHFCQENADADYFMELVQSNPTKLDLKNQAIKKYNIALEAANQGSYDLAVIQLKKVMSLNPNFLRAAHLLSLLYIQTGDYERARRLLKKVSKIDVSNTVTLRYFAEINAGISEGHTSDQKRKDISDNPIMPIVKYREDNPNVLAWVNWFLGMAVGIAVTFLLIVPTVKTNIRAEYDKNEIDYAGEVSVLNASILSKDNEIKSLTMQLEDTKDEIIRMKTEEFNPDMYNDFISVVVKYQDYIQNGNQADDDWIQSVAKELSGLNKKVTDSPAASEIYKEMTDQLYPLASEITYKIGKTLYDEKKYDEAYAVLSESYVYNPDRDTILFQLGLVCQELEQFEEASIYYNQLIDQYSGTSLALEAMDKLNEMSE